MSNITPSITPNNIVLSVNNNDKSNNAINTPYWQYLNKEEQNDNVINNTVSYEPPRKFRQKHNADISNKFFNPPKLRRQNTKPKQIKKPNIPQKPKNPKVPKPTEIQCECGKIIKPVSMRKHLQTIFHKNYEDNKLKN